MGRGRTLLLATAMIVLAIVPAARAALTAESMYQPGTVVSIKLSLPKKSIEKLEKAPEEKYVEGTFSLAESDGTPAGLGPFSAPMTVGIKLKGSAGSLRTLKEKAAFKISFGKYVEGQTFLGLQKMTLNNMVQDASMVHETLAYELFRANHVAGSHTGFAYLHVNLNGQEENFGMHLNIETMDRVALEERFGPFVAPPQHLYAGEYDSDVTPSQEGNFEVSEGEESERVDLERLVAAVGAASPADFSERVAPYADLQEMAHQFAVEKYIGHWDGYAGQQGAYQPNNYYLFSSAAGVFQMLPWGTDQTWGDRLSFDGAAGVLFDDCLADESCRTMYLRALRELLASLPAVGAEALATRTAALLEPWQALEEAPRRQNSAGEIHGAVESVLSFAEARPGELESFLAGESAEKPATRVAVAAEPGTIPSGGGSGTVTAAVTGAAGEPIFGERLAFSAPGLSFGPVVDRGEGIYTASFSGAPPQGQVKITATDSTAGISGTGVLSVEAPPAPPPSGGSTPGSAGAAGGGATGGGSGGGAKPAAVPSLSLRRAPGHRTTSRRPVFAFGSDQPGTTFVCRLGERPFKPCASPLRMPRLSPGHHVLTIAPVGPEGDRGTPRRYGFVVSIRRRTRVPD